MPTSDRKKSPKLQLDHKIVHKSVAEIFQLISSRKWYELKQLLRKNTIRNKSSVSKCTGPCCSKCNSTHNVLHFACQFRPPPQVIKILYEANPKAVFEVDCKGRHPLHIACKHGCNPDVVKFLLEKNLSAAKKLDTKDRTPFLLACKSYVSRTNYRWRIGNACLTEVLQMLSEVDTISFLNEDYKGSTALEYAINQELPIEVVEYLQVKMSCQVKKEMQKNQKDRILECDLNEFSQIKDYILPRSQNIQYGRKFARRNSIIPQKPNPIILGR